MSTGKLLRVAEVAKRLNCSVATVYNLVESKRLGHLRCPGVRITEEQLADYLVSATRGRVSSAPETKNTRPRLRHIKL